jgi:alpha-1,6-mannosyltransferase
MKIIDVTEFYSDRGGGVRSHLTSRSHVLYQRGDQHLVVAPGGKDEEQDGPPHVLRLKGPSLPYDPSYHLLYRVDRVRARIMRERPDVVEIHSPYVAALAALAVPRRTRTYRAIRTFQWHADFIDTYLRPAIHGGGGETGARVADVALDPLWRWVRTIGQGCDATLVAARWQEQKLRAHGVPRVHRIPFGIDKQVFRPQRRSDEVRRELLGEAQASHPKAQLLLSVGRFASEKRWDVVIDAFLAYRARRLAHPEAGPVVLAFFGDGPELARMEARAAGCPDVRFLGFARGRERLASALASADALLHGCPYETYGLSIAEALSAGLPALVPDEGGAAEMLGDGAPRGGLRYRALDVLACSSAIAAILERADALRPAAIEQAATVPSVAESVEATAELYERLLANR